MNHTLSPTKPWVRTCLSNSRHRPITKSDPIVGFLSRELTWSLDAQRALLKGTTIIKGKPWNWGHVQGVCPIGKEDGILQSTVQNAERGNPEAPELWLTITRFELMSWQKIPCFYKTDDNLDSIENLLEEKLDFHEALNECKCFKILQSDVFHEHHNTDSSHSDCCSILYHNLMVDNQRN